LICADCGVESGDEARRWRAYHAVEELTDEDSVLPFCPECALREFGTGRGPLVRDLDAP
jgi:hypothetical protein